MSTTAGASSDPTKHIVASLDLSSVGATGLWVFSYSLTFQSPDTTSRPAHANLVHSLISGDGVLGNSITVCNSVGWSAADIANLSNTVPIILAPGTVSLQVMCDNSTSGQVVSKWTLCAVFHPNYAA